MSSRFAEIGAVHFRAVLSADQVQRVGALFDIDNRPGKRLSRDDVESVADLISASGRVGRVAVELMGPSATPVRALLLDKSETANWRLAWHQDRTIAVRERLEVPGFGPWSVKAGQFHVQPPHEITSAMVTLRVHVDAVGEDNAPLEVLPGSHRLGRLSNAEVDKLATEVPALACLADPGDVWAYSTPIVHASGEQRHGCRRRVLQLDYATGSLPAGLERTALV